jgi:uncharacterized protein YecT (DUF1311 family)
MNFYFLVALCALVFVQSSAGYALDCAKASSPVDKLICATPELKKADEQMGAIYFKLLHETADAEFREAIIKSQRRWIKVRSSGPDRFGLAEKDTTDDREVLLRMTHERLNFLQTAKPIHILELQRKIASEDGEGTFAGYRTFCVLQPPPYGGWDYECWGVQTRQHNKRICSSAMEWASGYMYEDRTVSVLKNGEPKVVATCSTNDSLSEQCPMDQANVWTKLDSHWNTNPDPSEPLPTSDVTNLWKYDADIDPSDTDKAWMHACLFNAIYPPPAVSRPSSKSNASGR